MKIAMQERGRRESEYKNNKRMKKEREQPLIELLSHIS